MIDLDQLIEKAEKATPGPRWVERTTDDQVFVGIGENHEIFQLDVSSFKKDQPYSIDFDQQDNDAAYLAIDPTTVGTLAKLLKGLLEEEPLIEIGREPQKRPIMQCVVCGRFNWKDGNETDQHHDDCPYQVALLATTEVE